MRKILINTSVFCLIALYIQLVYALVCLHIDGDRKIYNWEKVVLVSSGTVYVVSVVMMMISLIIDTWNDTWSNRR